MEQEHDIYNLCTIMLLRMLLEQQWNLQYVVATTDPMFRNIF